MNRSIPPSGSRIFAAAQRGHYPRSRLLLIGSGLAGLGSSCIFTGPPAISRLSSTVSAQFRGLPSSTDSLPSLAVALFHDAVPILLQFLFFLSLPVFVAWLLPALIFRSHRGHTAVPIPETIRPGAPYWLAGSLTVAIALLIVIHYLRSMSMFDIDRPFDVSKYQDGLRDLGIIFLRTGLILSLGGLIQLSLYKVALFQQLSLTRDEATQEQRLHDANPLVRQRIRNSGKVG